MPKTVVTSIVLSIVVPRAAAPRLVDVVLDGEVLVLVEVDDMVADTEGGGTPLY